MVQLRWHILTWSTSLLAGAVEDTDRIPEEE